MGQDLVNKEGVVKLLPSLFAKKKKKKKCIMADVWAGALSCKTFLKPVLIVFCCFFFNFFSIFVIFFSMSSVSF